MVHANLSGWLVRVQDRVRELVTGSNLPEHQKTLLYRINARKAWWVPTLELPWVIDAQRLVPVEHSRLGTTPEVVWIAVAPETLKLVRRLAKQAHQQIRFPNLSRVNTFYPGRDRGQGGDGAQRHPTRTCSRLLGERSDPGARQTRAGAARSATLGLTVKLQVARDRAGSVARRFSCTAPNTVSRSR